MGSHDGELVFTMVWQSLDTPYKMWNDPLRVKKYSTFFGQGVIGKCVKIDAEQRLVGIQLTTVSNQVDQDEDEDEHLHEHEHSHAHAHSHDEELKTKIQLTTVSNQADKDEDEHAHSHDEELQTKTEENLVTASSIQSD